MTLAFDFHPEAQAELFADVDWFDEREFGLGERFGFAVRAAIDLAVDSPESWAVWPGWEREPLVRSKGVSDFPYRVVYFVRDDLLGASAPRFWTTATPGGSRPGGSGRGPAGASGWRSARPASAAAACRRRRGARAARLGPRGDPGPPPSPGGRAAGEGRLHDLVLSRPGPTGRRDPRGELLRESRHRSRDQLAVGSWTDSDSPAVIADEDLSGTHGRSTRVARPTHRQRCEACPDQPQAVLDVGIPGCIGSGRFAAAWPMSRSTPLGLLRGRAPTGGEQ